MDARLLWMGRAGLDHAVTPTRSLLHGNGTARDTLARVMAFQSGFSASVRRRFLARFTCGFVCNPLYPDLAMEVKRQGMIQGALGLGDTLRGEVFDLASGCWTMHCSRAWPLAPECPASTPSRLREQAHDLVAQPARGLVLRRPLVPLQ